MFRTHSRTRAAAAGLVALLTAAALFLGGMAAGSAGGGTQAESTTAVALPDWFLPIWDSYGRDPAITPWFDFASLYDPTALRG